MNPYIPFETALQMFVIAYLTSVTILLAAAQTAIAFVETSEFKQ